MLSENATSVSCLSLRRLMDAQPNPVFNYGQGNVGRDKFTNVGNVYNSLHQTILVEAEKDCTSKLFNDGAC